MKQLTFQISDEAYNLLLQIQKSPAEYRDTEYETLRDFRESEEANHRKEEWFLARNNGGTLHLIYELQSFELVECDGESWHITYVLTNFAKMLLEKSI
jgi:hypothetical protein